CLQYHSPPLTF
nr:immunoglobulin light chain junction region [Macaca mulatta]